ncbi:MAG: hypothetical protein ONB51_20675 [candidate division KSB1 bacterium]|nr:hypothetical protein [candidate division KSB1 bacterium]
MRIVFHAVREKAVETIDPSKKHFAARALVVRPGIELIALQSIGRIVVFEGLRGRVETRQTAIGTQPQAAFCIFQNAIDDIVGQAVFFREAGKRDFLLITVADGGGRRRRRNPIEPAAKRAKPKPAGMVAMNGLNYIMAQAVGMSRIVPISRKRLGLAIKTIKAMARSNPKRSPAILAKGKHAVIAQTFWIFRIMKIARENPLCAVKLVEPVRCSNPKRAKSVFVNGGYNIGAYAARVLEVAAIMSKALFMGIEFVQTAMGADPEKASGIVGIRMDGPNPIVA